MESKTGDIDEQCGSNAEITCLAKKVEIINHTQESIVGFTVLSDEKVVVLTTDMRSSSNIMLYQSKTEEGKQEFEFKRVSLHGFRCSQFNQQFHGTKARAIARLDSNKIVVLCDNWINAHEGFKKCYQIKRLPYEWEEVTCTYGTGQHRESLIAVFSTENDKLQFSFHMKIGMRLKTTDTSQHTAIAYCNEVLAILFCPLKLELLNIKTGISESVNMHSFATEMFPFGEGQPFLTISNSDGQTHIYISLAAGGGIRKVTKIDTNGRILATFVEVNYVEPGPIAAVGDGTLVFGYNSKLLLMSEDLKILAKLNCGHGVEDMNVMQTEKGRYLYCLNGNRITQYSLL
ncbi:uncharacterized protein LOC128236544 [Mya arenaria]|uniref:uncharacterized protein LOC128236544 n=1 Tax=Mya arenaria TaxID=6604 RepID=UPI0022E8B3DD|nr:uncharacterized protein LOC128236544 [Mya arenaria]XP_052807422.1 uncharacterized protein LOC128236544 [Mya arenaria]XP_052807424.1 uncharacterized protein LOC128236544 [Mya arenaria]XP_052807425.1 uncharacterized protein LOC128236544 [Mya arenaria]